MKVKIQTIIAGRIGLIYSVPTSAFHWVTNHIEEALRCLRPLQLLMVSFSRSVLIALCLSTPAIAPLERKDSLRVTRERLAKKRSEKIEDAKRVAAVEKRAEDAVTHDQVGGSPHQKNPKGRRSQSTQL